MKISAVVPAAGRGSRMGESGGIDKPYILLGDKPILAHTLIALNASSIIDEIIIVVHSKYIKYCNDNIVKRYGLKNVKNVVKGEKTRLLSVYNGLKEVSLDSDLVLIHDGVRPFVDFKIISRVIKEASSSGAAVAAVPERATVKQVLKDRVIHSTLNRESLWEAQTPQVFSRGLIMSAYERAKELGIDATDDAALVEAMGHKVKVVMGSYSNIKITTPEDLTQKGDGSIFYRKRIG